VENIDITIGQATVPWAEVSYSHNNPTLHSAGWVLPGGQRTTDKGRAILAAARMNAYIMGVTPVPADFWPALKYDFAAAGNEYNRAVRDNKVVFLPTLTHNKISA